MCVCIAIASKNLDRADEFLRGYYPRTFKDVALCRLLPASHKWSWLTDGHCACSLHTHLIHLEAEIAKVEAKYSTPKYRKRGWTDRRIADKVAGLRKTSAAHEGGLDRKLFAALQAFVAAGNDCQFFVTDADFNDLDPIAKDTRRLRIGSGGDVSGPADVEQEVLYEMV